MQYQVGDLIENKYLVLASYPKLVINSELYIVYDFKTKQKYEYWGKINYDWKCLFLYASYGNYDIVKFFIKNEIDITIKDNYILRWASIRGFTKIIKLLIKNNIDVSWNDNYALRWAIKNGHLEIVKIILKKQDYNYKLYQKLLGIALYSTQFKTAKYLQFIIDKYNKYVII